MSHAQTGCRTDDENSFSGGRLTDWMHTANAATVLEHEVLMSWEPGLGFPFHMSTAGLESTNNIQNVF